jgi:hypothetical protein
MIHIACRVQKSTIRRIDDLSMAMPVGGLPDSLDGQPEIVATSYLWSTSKTGHIGVGYFTPTETFYSRKTSRHWS